MHFLLIILLACEQPLSPEMEEVVFDSQIWIDNNIERIQERLDQDPEWEHQILGLDEQAWVSKYYERENFHNEYVAGRAHPNLNTIDLMVDHNIWKYVLDDFVGQREKWNQCEEFLYGLQSSQALRIICHENAHMIFIESHPDVYKVGRACLNLRLEDLVSWRNRCYLEQN